MRAGIIGAVFAAVLSMGCGGAGPVAEEPDVLGQVESAALSRVCGFQNYEVTFYSDAARTTVVGTGYCLCGNSLEVEGRMSDYYVKRSRPDCVILP
ncbi:hypothetical protein LXT21_35360 [Myxococcus sp. K38C18041901]|uniref:hypothetical protein n=1 Tax=Myxococcus guangdongensis TaxID=2906760 RepID=UPI0020A833BB|nr:hypothetical protein [Myxococcus guangdongensis]MCP3064066.1 hypothetical protein [Myxococcus guangdongensis]